ncbi:MAG: ATP-binding protein [Candidatus Hydrogenedens sp.]|jgi:ATP-dependent 26S proteasome regulatory subunit|nr:ATP-binding protein [Candidatus Hydrogenedens sp.]
MKTLSLDYTWIQNFESNAVHGESSIAVVENSDPLRADQLCAYLCKHYETVYFYSPWRGLQKRNQGAENQEDVTVSCNSAYDAALNERITVLKDALRYMDPLLSAEKIAFVLQGLDQPKYSLEKNQELMHAFWDWALKHEILERHSLIVLLATNKDAVLNRATINRTIQVRAPLAEEAERTSIVRSVASSCRQNRGLNLNELQIITKATAGLNLHQTQVAVRRSYDENRKTFDLVWLKKYKSDMIRLSELVELEEPEYGFEEVGGYEAVKKMVKDRLILTLQEPERAIMAAIDLPRGILFYGPPGTGKSYFAKALAKETNLPFINFRTENLFTPYLGETGQRLRDAIQIAEQAAPALVYIDEIDRFGQRATEGRGGAARETQRVFAQMLEWLGDQNRKSIVVGTTNVPEQMDAAFLRSGRFSYIVPFLYPDREARYQILRIQLGMEGNRPKPVMDAPSLEGVLQEIAEATEYYNGADLQELVERAKGQFFISSKDRLTEEHLRAAFNDFLVDIDNRETIVENYQILGREFTNTLTLIEQ